jgi:hypothetical protein
VPRLWVAPAQPVETCRAPGEEEEEPGALQIGDTGGIMPQFVVTRRRRDRRADVDIRRPNRPLHPWVIQATLVGLLLFGVAIAAANRP